MQLSSILGLIYSNFKPLLLNDLKRESKDINHLNNNIIDEMHISHLFQCQFLRNTQLLYLQILNIFNFQQEKNIIKHSFL